MAKRFTEKQGQYLAFIYNYTVMFGRTPSEADLPLRAMEVRSMRHVVAGRRGRVRVAEVA
jgi:hypothetical protein